MADSPSDAQLAALQRRIADLELLTYRCAHDLQGPLVTIAGFLKGLSTSAKAGEWETFDADLERILSAMDHLRGMLTDVMQVARGNAPEASQSVAMTELVRTASEQLAARLAERAVIIHVDEELPTIYGRKCTLIAVLQNLLENAIQATPITVAPRINIGCRRDGGETVFLVRDHGIGIQPADRQRVFEPFVRLDPQTGGVGLGLFLVKQIVEGHAGRVWMESPVGGPGTIVCFTLPIAVPE